MHTWQLTALLTSVLIGSLWFAKHAEVTAQETVKTVAKSVEKTAIQSAQTTAKETAKTVVAPVVQKVQAKQDKVTARIVDLQNQLNHANEMLAMCRENQNKVSARSEALSRELKDYRAMKHETDGALRAQVNKLSYDFKHQGAIR